MDKKIAGLLGAAAALTSLNAGAAVPAAADAANGLEASSYAELLEPVANAQALLKADDTARAASPSTGNVREAGYHHHHHHHRYHHHHHHHHRYHHHHHHHHHWY